MINRFRYQYKYLFNQIWFGILRIPVSLVLAALARILWIFRIKKSSTKICLISLRFHLSGMGISLLSILVKSESEYLLSLISADLDIEEAAKRTILLKLPRLINGKVEKGVLLIKFTKTFSYYLRNVNTDILSKYFYLVLEPSWSGYADPDILCWMYKSDNVIIQASELQDRVLLNCFPEKFVGVSFGSGDWVDRSVFYPVDSEKIYDSIYVANNNPIKRVERYLIAIRNILDHGDGCYKACLICSSWGGEDNIIEKLVHKYNLKDSVDLRFSLTVKEVAKLINMSKCNILLSLKEGSNRSLFESMFCNVPVICLSENIGVNKSYINEYTGLLIPDNNLESSLIWLSKNYKNITPIKWAEKNISSTLTRDKLCEVINQRFSEEFKYKEIYEKVNSPEATYKEDIFIDAIGINRNVLNLFDRNANFDFEIIENELNDIYLKMNSIN